MKDYQFILTQIKDRFTDILEDNLVGIYVHGSIVFHCFHWANSDIDFIVVVKDKLSKTTKRRLLDELFELRSIAPPKGVEMSIVLEQYCHNFVYPTPYELHYSDAWQTAYIQDPDSLCTDTEKVDKDLAAHFTIINHMGIELYGQPIATTFAPVPEQYYIDSLLNDLESAPTDILDAPRYVVLNLCRVLAYLKHHLILSKDQAATWGLTNLPPEYIPLLEEAQLSYNTNRSMRFNHKLAVNFCNYMLPVIKDLASKRK